MTEQPVRGADGEYLYLNPSPRKRRGQPPFSSQHISSVGSSTTNLTHTPSPCCVPSSCSQKGCKNRHQRPCLPEPGQESPWDEKIIRTMHLVMLTLLNSQERTTGEFKDLFWRADPCFSFKGVTRPKGCRMSIMKAVWLGEDFGGSATVTDQM